MKTPLLIAAGLLGVPLAIGLSHAWSDDDNAVPADDAPPVTLDSNTEYPMNHFVPGAGYYHVPYHAWFPFPYDYHDGSRGWYRGGQWRNSAVEDSPERSGFAGDGAGRSFATSRPLPEAVQRANAGAISSHASGSSSGGGHVSRGGFGFSAHPSGA